MANRTWKLQLELIVEPMMIYPGDSLPLLNGGFPISVDSEDKSLLRLIKLPDRTIRKLKKASWSVVSRLLLGFPKCVKTGFGCYTNHKA